MRCGIVVRARDFKINKCVHAYIRTTCSILPRIYLCPAPCAGRKTIKTPGCVWWIGVAVTSPTCRPARRSFRGFESRTQAGGLRYAVRGKVCVYGLCMGFGVHTALINLHPVFGSVEYGFELCRMYRS